MLRRGEQRQMIMIMIVNIGSRYLLHRPVAANVYSLPWNIRIRCTSAVVVAAAPAFDRRTDHHRREFVAHFGSDGSSLAVDVVWSAADTGDCDHDRLCRATHDSHGIFHGGRSVPCRSHQSRHRSGTRGRNVDPVQLQVHSSIVLVTDHVSREGKAIGSVRPSVCFH